MKHRHGFALIALLVAEWTLFYTATTQRHAWVYPRWFDQVQYLGDAYRAYEYRVEHGLVAGLRHALTNFKAQGALQDFWAVLMFSAAGPSRTSALALNLIAFAALQAATFFAVRRVVRSTALAWAAVGLLVAWRGPWAEGAGSMSDFRLDGMAACAYGGALAAAVAGNGLRSTRWAVLLGVAVGVAILTRFLTAVYFAGIYVLLAAWLALQSDRWARIGRLALSGGVALGLCAPALWHGRQEIHDYYWIGHMDGPERALRASHLNLGESLAWVLARLGTDHLGGVALALASGGAGVFFLLGRWRRTRETAPAPPPAWREAWVVAGGFGVVPVLVLSAHELKAAQPVSVVLPAAAWLVVLGWAELARGVKPGARALVGAAVVAVAAGGTATTTLLRRMPEDERRAAVKVNALLDTLYYRAEESELTQPRFAVTRVSATLSAPLFGVLGYERHGRWLTFLQTLPTGLLETTPEIAMQLLGESDFVGLVAGGSPTAWPYDRAMEKLQPGMRAWCDEHLTHLADEEVGELTFRLYERADLLRPSGGVELARMVADAEREPTRRTAAVPAAPRWPGPMRVIGAVNAEISRRLVAAYDVREYRATGLPEGLRLEARSGVVTGKLRETGTWTASITAVNASGATTGDVTFTAVEKSPFAEVSVPASGQAGRPIEISFGAFDATGRFSFVDVLDLTEGKLLRRVPANAEEGQSWQGRQTVSLARPGRHTLMLRFVRFDPKAKEPYSFFDESRDITVTAPEATPQ